MVSMSTAVVREVWAYNLDYEFDLIRRCRLLCGYRYISMDTEFPGVIFKASQCGRPCKQQQYGLLKSNVDALSLIQLGLTLSDPSPSLPTLVWEFNFNDFDLARGDPHAPDSIDLLRQNGINFAKNRSHGVDSARFANHMLRSGLVFSPLITWVTFHSTYDFGYLVKILTRRVLSHTLNDFLGIVRVLFGHNVYDVKHMMRFCKGLYGGLERVAKSLEIERAVGKCHQAGSDSLLTWHTFEKIRGLYFVEHGPEVHAGVLYGLEAC